MLLIAQLLETFFTLSQLLQAHNQNWPKIQNTFLTFKQFCLSFHVESFDDLLSLKK